jgi:hypothetical protein
MKTSTAINMEDFEMMQAYNRLCMYPEDQSLAIASHYAAHAQVAKELLRLIAALEYVHPDVVDGLNITINNFVEIIKTNHRHDLGLELKWAKGEQNA